MQHFIVTYGYLAVFVLMVAESAWVPIPSELIMTFGGAIAAGAVPGTHLNLVLVIVAGVVGNVVGSYLAWAVGKYAGQAVVRRWGRRIWLREHDVDRASEWLPGAARRPPDRPSPARRADVHLTARRFRGHARGAVRRLHHHRLHPVDNGAGPGRVRGRRQLARIVNGFHGVTYVIAAVVVLAVIAAVWIFFRRRRAEIWSGGPGNGARHARPEADRSR